MVTRQEAGAGYEVLVYHAAKQNYLATMWLSAVDDRFREGQHIEGLMGAVLRAAYSWYAKASASLYPTYIDEGMCLELFAVMNVEPPPPVENYVGHGTSQDMVEE